MEVGTAQVKLIVPVKPLIGVTAILVVAVWPLSTEIGEVGDAGKVKSEIVTVMADDELRASFESPL